VGINCRKDGLLSRAEFLGTSYRGGLCPSSRLAMEDSRFTGISTVTLEIFPEHIEHDNQSVMCYHLVSTETQE